MQGIQYTVVGTFPPLYVIMKQRRNSPTNGNHALIYPVFHKIMHVQLPQMYNKLLTKNIL